MPVKLEHGKQLDRGNPEILQVWDFLDHARIGPAPLRGDPRVRMPREAGDVYLVDLRWRRAGAAAPPHPPSRRRWGRPPHSSWRSLVPPVSARRVARTPVGHDDSPPVGIEERFGRIEAQAALGIERPVGAIPINLAGMDAGHKDVQVMVGAMCEDRARSHAPGAWRRLHDKGRRLGSCVTVAGHLGRDNLCWIYDNITSPSRQSRPSSFWIAISATARRTSRIPPPPTAKRSARKRSACASGAMGGPRMRSSSSSTDGIETTRERIPPAITRHGNTRTACCRHM